MDQGKKYRGTVIFYDKGKGFGSIETQGLGNVYLHYSKMVEGYTVAHPTDEIEFEIIPSTKKRGVYEAINVQYVSNEHKDTIIEAFQAKRTIKGKVKEINSGGLLIDFEKIELFMPKSEVDIYEFNSFRIFQDKILEFKVIGISDRSFIVSRKQVILEEDDELRRVKPDSSPKEPPYKREPLY